MKELWALWSELRRKNTLDKTMATLCEEVRNRGRGCKWIRVLGEIVRKEPSTSVVEGTITIDDLNCCTFEGLDDGNRFKLYGGRTGVLRGSKVNSSLNTVPFSLKFIDEVFTSARSIDGMVNYHFNDVIEQENEKTFVVRGKKTVAETIVLHGSLYMKENGTSIWSGEWYPYFSNTSTTKFPFLYELKKSGDDEERLRLKGEGHYDYPFTDGSIPLGSKCTLMMKKENSHRFALEGTVDNYKLLGVALRDKSDKSMAIGTTKWIVRVIRSTNERQRTHKPKQDVHLLELCSQCGECTSISSETDVFVCENKRCCSEIHRACIDPQYIDKDKAWYCCHECFDECNKTPLKVSTTTTLSGDDKMNSFMKFINMESLNSETVKMVQQIDWFPQNQNSNLSVAPLMLSGTPRRLQTTPKSTKSHRILTNNRKVSQSEVRQKENTVTATNHPKPGSSEVAAISSEKKKTKKRKKSPNSYRVSPKSTKSPRILTNNSKVSQTEVRQKQNTVTATNPPKTGSSEVVAKGEVVYPYIGLDLVALTPRIARKHNKDPNAVVQLPERSGVLVEAVFPDSPAEKAGLRRGDLLITVDERDIADFQALHEVVDTATIEIDVPLPLKVLRAGRELTLSVKPEPKIKSRKKSKKKKKKKKKSPNSYRVSPKSTNPHRILTNNSKVSQSKVRQNQNTVTVTNHPKPGSSEVVAPDSEQDSKVKTQATSRTIKIWKVNECNNVISFTGSVAQCANKYGFNQACLLNVLNGTQKSTKSTIDSFRYSATYHHDHDNLQGLGFMKTIFLSGKENLPKHSFFNIYFKEFRKQEINMAILRSMDEPDLRRMLKDDFGMVIGRREAFMNAIKVIKKQ